MTQVMKYIKSRYLFQIQLLWKWWKSHHHQMTFQQAQWDGFVAWVQFLMDKSPHYKKQHTTGSNWYSFGTQQRSEVLNEHEEWTNLSPPPYARSGMRHLIELHRKLGLLLSVPPCSVHEQRTSFLTNIRLTLFMNSKFMWKIWRFWKLVFNLRILPKDYRLLLHIKPCLSDCQMHEKLLH